MMVKNQNTVSWKMKHALRAQTDILNKLQELIIQTAPRRDSLDREIWLKPDPSGEQYRGFLFSVLDLEGKLPPNPTHAWRIYHQEPTKVVMEALEGDVLAELDLADTFYFSRNRKEQQDLLVAFIRQALKGLPLDD